MYISIYFSFYPFTFGFAFQPELKTFGAVFSSLFNVDRNRFFLTRERAKNIS
ncbi:hypothetical protein PORCAN_603 [Porphyromonas crevioricanis JCM 13913]|nr:hypothetical protein PORCAN_603 [Porphyromonas crevioricanis JCM 13913]